LAIAQAVCLRGRWRRGGVRCATAVIVLVALLQALTPATQETVFRKTPYLVWTGRPETMSLMWELRAREPGFVVLRAADGREEARVEGVEVAELLFRADLGPLASDAEYSYQVFVGSQSFAGTLRTLPPPTQTKTVFWGIADTQQAAVRDMSPFVKAIVEDVADVGVPSVLLHAGDWVQTLGAGGVPAARLGTIGSQWDKLFHAMEPLASIMPVAGIAGNHEAGGLAAAAFSKYWPYGDTGCSAGKCRSFDIGPVHVIAVGFVSAVVWGLTPEQALWVVHEAEANRSRPWTVLLVHYFEAIGPQFSTREGLGSGMGPGGWPWAEDVLLDVLSARGLDLVLSGHVHCHDLFTWDGVTRQHVRMESTVPVLTMANATFTEAGCTPYWYRFEVIGNTMRVVTMDSAGTAVSTDTLTARP
jgi:hypothetical protein